METRRDILGLAAALAPLLAFQQALAAGGKPMTMDEAMKLGIDSHERLMAVPGLNMHGNETVSMLLYPQFTALDIVAPHYFFACMMGAKVELVTTKSNLAPVASDLKLAIEPTHRLEDAAAAPDILFIPGGTAGTLDAAENAEVMRWVKDRGAKAKQLASVCTGAIVLGQAGLLKGRRATAHWVVRDELARFGATPVDRRVVSDGNLTTGAGVTAGIDLALALVQKLRGLPYAQALSLQAEYRPEPPFAGGTFATTPRAIAEPMRDMFAPLVARIQALPAV